MDKATFMAVFTDVAIAIKKTIEAPQPEIVQGHQHRYAMITASIDYRSRNQGINIMEMADIDLAAIKNAVDFLLGLSRVKCLTECLKFTKNARLR
jgi:hypothetical protein